MNPEKNKNTKWKPKGAIGQINGLWYKIGYGGKAYFWANDEWIKSSKNVDDVVRSLRVPCLR